MAASRAGSFTGAWYYGDVGAFGPPPLKADPEIGVGCPTSHRLAREVPCGSANSAAAGDSNARASWHSDDYGKSAVDFHKPTSVTSIPVDKDQFQLGLSDAAASMVKSALGNSFRGSHELVHLMGLRNTLTHIYADSMKCLREPVGSLQDIEFTNTTQVFSGTRRFGQAVDELRNVIVSEAVFNRPPDDAIYVDDLQVTMTVTEQQITVAHGPSWYQDFYCTKRHALRATAHCTQDVESSLTKLQQLVLRLRQMREALAALLAEVCRLVRSITSGVDGKIWQILRLALSRSFFNYCVNFRPWHTNHGAHPPDLSVSLFLSLSA